MTQKVKLVVSLAVFALVLAGAAFAYGALRDRAAPDIQLAPQQGSISAPESSAPESLTPESLTPESSTPGSAIPQAESSPSEPDKMQAPDFAVVDADGNSVKLSEMIANGKPVVLNFWASWCPPCKDEMPEFDTVYKEMSGDVTFFMVDLTDGQRETVEMAAKHVYDNGFSFPIYFDTKQEAANAYGIRSIPTTIFIDKDGHIVTGAEGQLDEKTLRYGISLIQAQPDSD